MTTTHLQDLTHLHPLLRSIGEEIVERAEAILELEARIRDLSPRMHEAEISRHHATIAAHKRELRYAQGELDRLGCRIEDIHPLTFRIGDDDEDSQLWTLDSPPGSPRSAPL